MNKVKKETGSEHRLDVTLIDQWLAEHYRQPQDILGREGLLAKLTKAVVERALGAELTHHLGYAEGATPIGENCRNGTSAKTLLGDGGRVEIAVPRDRHSSFEPRLIAKGQTRFAGFDEKIIAMYARGMTGGIRKFVCGSVSCFSVSPSPRAGR
jgi:putative transposase